MARSSTRVPKPTKGHAMQLQRRRFLQLAAGAAVMPAMPYVARAQGYPTRPVRIVVSYPAGGVSDIYARLLAQSLSERIGQSFLIENRPGAGGTVGVDSVARAPADGYTLLLTASNDAYNENLYPEVKFKYVRDIAPVGTIAVATHMLEVNPSFPAISVPDFIAYAKANPGRVN